MDIPATGASLSGGARCAVSGIPTAFLIAGCFKTDQTKKLHFRTLEHYREVKNINRNTKATAYHKLQAYNRRH
jgi:hypothetical protein